MPPESRDGNSGAHVFLEHTLGVFHYRKAILSDRRACRASAREEVGRRELLWIAHNNELFATDDGPHRVLRRKLTRLIEDHEIERRGPSAEVLGDCQRAHQEARFDGAYRRLRVLKGLTQRI